MPNKFIPYGRQWITEDDIEEVVKVLRSDFLTTGPKAAEFEKAFCEYVGAKYAVAVSSATAGLHIACLAAGITEGDEVIVPPITFAATSNCVLYCGGTPVFADIDEKTYNISVDDIRKKITSKTKAIIPVHFTGQPCEMDEIYKLAEEFNLLVIEDASHAVGAEYRGEKIGKKSYMAIFSFHPVKHITMGEGGIVTTNDLNLYRKLLKFRTHGITRDLDLMEAKDAGPWYYEQQDLGYNYRITDFQCALGISQLKRIDTILEKRLDIVKIYDEAFKEYEGLVIPFQNEYVKSSWHIYVIQLELDKLTVDRRVIFEALRACNLGVNVHYIPVYYFPYYRNLGYEKGLCPVAEALYESIITIPLFPTMSKEDVDYVIQSVKECIQKYIK